MDEWEALRTIGIVAAWVTVLGGLTMAVVWLAAGGAKAIGPDDELMAQSGVPVAPGRRRFTSFSSANVGIHGLIGILTASLLTYALATEDDRQTGYIAVLVALVVAGVPGLLMFHKWRTGHRPNVPEAAAVRNEPRPEDRLPRVVVYLHGLAALATAGLVVALLILD